MRDRALYTKKEVVMTDNIIAIMEGMRGLKVHTFLVFPKEVREEEVIYSIPREDLCVDKIPTKSRMKNSAMV